LELKADPGTTADPSTSAAAATSALDDNSFFYRLFSIGIFPRESRVARAIFRESPGLFPEVRCDYFRKVVGAIYRQQVWLFAEDLHHRLGLSLTHLGERFGNEGAILEAAGVEHFSQAEGGMTEEHLGVLEALVVVGDRKMNLLGEFLNVFEEGRGLVLIASGGLAQAEFGHLMHDLSVEETLVARLSDEGLGFEIVNRPLVDGFVIESGGAGLESGDRDEDE
jgi:hypothetical protein